MSRPVFLGNGSLAVGLNELGLVQDFYYPYVGLDNLTNARLGSHRIGVWVDGEFSWVNADEWEISVDFEVDALISTVQVHHPKLKVSMLLKDLVDQKDNIFARDITIRNTAEHSREIRLFMHQVFQISRSGRGDTALYVPDDHYLLDYKGRCSLLISGKHDGSDVASFDQYAVGNYGIEGKEGTFKDAEDGELSGSTVEHGGVDSVMRFTATINPGETQSINYWIVASDSQYIAEKIHRSLIKTSFSSLYDQNRQTWHEWFAESANALHTIKPEYVDLVKKSLMLIKAHTDKRGGVIASGDSSIYNYGRDYYSYVWPRDGAYAIWPLIRLGHYKEARNFFSFCRDIISDDGYLMHKYQPDKSIGSTWHPLLHNDRKELAIQEDETAIVLYMLGEYYQYSGDEDFVQSLYETMIRPMANFMCRFTDEETGLPHASYDLWEEKFLTTTYTVATVYQALLVAADFAEDFNYPDDAVKWRETADSFKAASDIFFYPDRNYYRKGYILSADQNDEAEQMHFDNILDMSSVYGVMMFDYHTHVEKLHDSVKALEKYLLNKSPVHGLPRYEHDQYFAQNPPYMGNPWFVTTLWLAQYYIRNQQIPEAKKLINWAVEHTLPSGVMSEQIHPERGEPISVAPLVWSHAEFVNTVLDLSRAER